MGGTVKLLNGTGFGYSDGCELDKLGTKIAEKEEALQRAYERLREAEREVQQREVALKNAKHEFYRLAHRAGQIDYWIQLLATRSEAYSLWQKLMQFEEQLAPDEREDFLKLIESPYFSVFRDWYVPAETVDALQEEHTRLQGNPGRPFLLEQMEDEFGRLFFLDELIDIEH